MNKIYLSLTLLVLPYFIKSQSQLPSNVNHVSDLRGSVYKMEEVFTYIDRMYVDTVDIKEITENAIVSTLENLDPHSVYISKEDVDDANQQIDGSFFGVGIRFQILKDTLMVVQTIPGGPSEKVGVQAGDRIIKIDQELVAGVGLKNSQVRQKLMGEKDTKVNIQVERAGKKKLLNFTITRGKIPIHSVDSYYMVNNETGYIKLSSFSRNTMEEVHEALSVLVNKGMKNLVFDLQGNGGGLLYAAQRVADEFLSDNKLIVYSEGKYQPRQELKAGMPGKWEKGKMIVLTDEFSASASEIVSGAIQDWDRGLIIGRRTFGKGLVQRPIELSDGSQMRLTIARYYTPSGRFIQKPYDDYDTYRNDIVNRYEHGEFSNADSIHLVDSLKYATLLNKRSVYGGGGIMPDIFVPIDTANISDYFRKLVQGGHINHYSLTYTNDNRNELKSSFENFNHFKKDFNCDEQFMKSFFEYVAKEDPELEYNDEEYQESKAIIKLQLKALIAQNIYGYNEFYEIYNETNEILQRALEVLKNNEFDKFNIQKK